MEARKEVEKLQHDYFYRSDRLWHWPMQTTPKDAMEFYMNLAVDTVWFPQSIAGEPKPIILPDLDRIGWGCGRCHHYGSQHETKICCSPKNHLSKLWNEWQDILSIAIYYRDWNDYHRQDPNRYEATYHYDFSATVACRSCFL